MEDLEARKILHENGVLVDPSDHRSYPDIVRVLGYMPVANDQEETGLADRPTEIPDGNCEAPVGNVATNAANEQSQRRRPILRTYCGDISNSDSGLGREDSPYFVK